MPVVVNGIEMDRGLIEELREGAGAMPESPRRVKARVSRRSAKFV